MDDALSCTDRSSCAGLCAPLPPRVPTLLTRQLIAKHAVYSQSFWSDWWLWMKNEHIFISQFLAHPYHRFTRRERVLALLSSVLFALGLTSFFNTIPSRALRLLMSMSVGVVLQTVGDTKLEAFGDCRCLPSFFSKLGCPGFFIDRLQCLGRASISIVLLEMIAFCAVGLWQFQRYTDSWFYTLLVNSTLLNSTRTVIGSTDSFSLIGISLDDDDIQPTTESVVLLWAASKATSFALILPITETLMFAFTRWWQAKPRDAELVWLWQRPTTLGVFFCRPGCGPVIGKPRDGAWNEYNGGKDDPGKTMADLPAHAPGYPITIRLFGLTVYKPSVAEGSTAAYELQAINRAIYGIPDPAAKQEYAHTHARSNLPMSQSV